MTGDLLVQSGCSLFSNPSMIILSWNVRGLNSTCHQKFIHDLIVIHSPDVFCVQETKVFVEVMHQLDPCIWYTGHYQSIGLQGNYGVLALFWDPHKISPLWWISSHYSISMVATSLDFSETILATNVYVIFIFGITLGMCILVLLIFLGS